jgi:hypothetical protein
MLRTRDRQNRRLSEHGVTSQKLLTDMDVTKGAQLPPSDAESAHHHEDDRPHDECHFQAMDGGGSIASVMRRRP